MKVERIKSLQEKHAEIEAKLHRESISPWRNEAMIRQLKKMKLRLRDEILGAMPRAA